MNKLRFPDSNEYNVTFFEVNCQHKETSTNDKNFRQFHVCIDKDQFGTRGSGEAKEYPHDIIRRKKKKLVIKPDKFGCTTIIEDSLSTGVV